jgi:hypothetical protein
MLFKVDLKSAFRQLPVDPGDIHLLSYVWKGHIYMDKVMAMGCRSAAMCCQRLTDAISYVFCNMGYACVNYLDDFGGVDTYINAGRAYNGLRLLLSRLGIVVSENKCSAPNQSMVFLGVLCDTNALTLSITPQRLDDIKQELNSWLGKTYTCLRDIQSLLGKLNFVGKCIPSSRIFIARLLNFIRGLKSGVTVLLDYQFKKDISWWVRYIQEFNGTASMILEEWGRPDEVLQVDSCLYGCGGLCGSEFFHSAFPPEIVAMHLDINCLEMLCIKVSLEIWGHVLVGKRLLIKCDNMVSVESLNFLKTKNIFLQDCVRAILYIASCNNFQIRAIHIPGLQNRLPDWLSRWDLDPKYKHKFLEAVNIDSMVEKHVLPSWFHVVDHW